MAARIDAWFAPLAADRDFSGIIRVERGGRLIAERRYGYADWSNRTAHDGETLFSAASVTKGIVAATLLSLKADNMLSLEDRLETHLPSLAPITDATLRDVLHHRAGLPRDVPAGVDVTAPDALVTWLASNRELLQPPGEERYSNVGYALLAQAIGAATGRSFADVARERVLAPAGMTSSFIDARIAGDLPGGAKPYIAGPAPDGVETPLPAPLEIGSSGLITTAADLARWGRALGLRSAAM